MMKVFDGRSFELVHELGKHMYGVNSLFTRGSTVWIAYVDQTIGMWDLEK